MRDRIKQGQPLAESLYWGGLLPAATVPLVHAAERVNNLPWALTELGDMLGNRSVRALRRFSQVVSPLFVVLIGLVVGFAVIAMFMPLIQVIQNLTSGGADAEGGATKAAGGE